MLSRSRALFLKHEPCPKCGSRDNLGRYSDGSAWCFGCGYYERPHRTLENSRPREIPDPEGWGFLTEDLPKEAVAWLKQYGLSNEECSLFRWNPEKKRLIFTIVYEDGSLFSQGRAFGDGPKYLTRGRLNWDHPLWFGDGSVIFTEDVVSAIKVGRHACGVPVFGSHVPAKALKWASERSKQVGIWLDPDKVRESHLQATKAQAMGMPVYSIQSPKDPKEHSDREILTFLDFN